jgi:hypothetical protein
MIPVPLMSPGVEIHNNDGSAFSSTLSCPSNPGKSGGDGIMLVQKTDSLKTEIDNLEATLQQNIDGGSTAETAEDVFYSTLDETYSVYSDLMEKSPYLSDTVMKNAVMREDTSSQPASSQIRHALQCIGKQGCTSQRYPYGRYYGQCRSVW